MGCGLVCYRCCLVVFWCGVSWGGLGLLSLGRSGYLVVLCFDWFWWHWFVEFRCVLYTVWCCGFGRGFLW